MVWRSKYVVCERTYKDKKAVDGVDLTVELGEVFALLGPNGAGKTTTVEILEGYRRRGQRRREGPRRRPVDRGCRLALAGRHRPARYRRVR